MIVATFIGFVFIFIWSYGSQVLFQKIYPPIKLIMVYDRHASAKNLVKKIAKRADKYHVCKAIDLDEGVDLIMNEISNYEGVIFSDLPSPIRNDLLKFCYNKNITVYMTPKISDILIRTAKEIELFDSPLLLTQNQEFSIEQRIFKRSVDILSSILGIIITLPITLLICLVIKLEDKGPVFYTQERFTRSGKIFKMYKFRSMIVNADKIEGPRLVSENDDRITRVGKFIRKFRIDELPQLFNILKGEMSLVGPRPEHPEIEAEYEKEIPEFRYRLKVKAGLTGYAQVIGKYNTTPYDKIKMDLMYISGYSMLLDIKIIFMTFKIIFFKEDSTEGIKEGQSTAGLCETEKTNEK